VAAGIIEGEHRDIAWKSFVERGDGFFRLFHHLLRVPPAIITIPAAIFNYLCDLLFPTLFITAIQPSLHSAKKLRDHYPFAL